MNGEHELDRRAGESDQEYNDRINAAADRAGQSRVEYERAANERAGRPAKTAPDNQE
jgi:hypothetical protein